MFLKLAKGTRFVSASRIAILTGAHRHSMRCQAVFRRMTDLSAVYQMPAKTLAQ